MGHDMGTNNRKKSGIRILVPVFIITVVVTYAGLWGVHIWRMWAGHLPEPGGDPTVPGGAFFEFMRTGEQLAVLVAFASLVAWATNEAIRNRESEEQRIRTARYWVLYNCINRITQDLNVHRQIGRLLRNSDYQNVAASMDYAIPYSQDHIGDIQFDRHEFPVPDQRHFSVVNVVRTQAWFFLRGFKDTWTNDDVLTAAIAFDFSLLTSDEKTYTLVYFEKYNSLQDDVNFVFPILDKMFMPIEGEHYPTDSIVATSPELQSRLLRQVYYRIPCISITLTARLQQAIELVVLIAETAKKERFEGVEGQMPRLVRQAWEQGVPIGRAILKKYDLAALIEQDPPIQTAKD